MIVRSLSGSCSIVRSFDSFYYYHISSSHKVLYNHDCSGSYLGETNPVQKSTLPRAGGFVNSRQNRVGTGADSNKNFKRELTNVRECLNPITARVRTIKVSIHVETYIPKLAVPCHDGFACFVAGCSPNKKKLITSIQDKIIESHEARMDV